MSSLSVHDSITLQASWHYTFNKSFQCERFESLMSNRKDKDLIIEIKRKEKGCKVIGKETKVTIDNYAFKSCLCHPNFQHPLFYFLLEIREKYKEGILPFSGSLMEQPAQIIELLNFIKRLEIEQEIEDRKEKKK